MNTKTPDYLDALYDLREAEESRHSSAPKDGTGKAVEAATCPQCGSRDEAASELCSNRWHQSIHDLVNAVEAADAKVLNEQIVGRLNQIDAAHYKHHEKLQAALDAARAEIERLTKLWDTEHELHKQNVYGYQSELTTLRAKLAEAERYAGRYRWLRSEESELTQITKLTPNIAIGDCILTMLSGDSLDAAIDAALQQGSTKGE